MPNTKKVNKGGRPPRFSSVEALDQAITEYNKICQDSNKLPNKAGLCVHLKIVKDTYCEWKKNGHRFTDSIKAFEVIVENAWVQRLGGNSPTGAIFYLKNAFKDDYREKTETDITTGGMAITGMQIIKDADNIQDKK